MMLRIAVIGDGIGGLTAAVALLQAGFDVEVYESQRRTLSASSTLSSTRSRSA